MIYVSDKMEFEVWLRDKGETQFLPGARCEGEAVAKRYAAAQRKAGYETVIQPTDQPYTIDPETGASAR